MTATGIVTEALTLRRMSRARCSTDMSSFQRIGGDDVEVEFERIRAGLLNQARVVQPAGRRGAVQGADDRHTDGGFDPTDLLQIGLRAD